MKRSRKPLSFNIDKLAKDYQLSPITVKLALVGSTPHSEAGSIPPIKTVKQAEKLFLKAKSFTRQEVIAFMALEICTNLEDIDHVYNFGADIMESRPLLWGAWVSRRNHELLKELTAADTFSKVHDLWCKIFNEKEHTEVDSLAYRKMIQLIPATSLYDVLTCLEGDLGSDVYNENSQQYPLIVHACELATPIEAHGTLKRLEDDSKEDSHPIRILIRKVAGLYKN